VANKYKVGKRQWKYWNKTARKQFNNYYPYFRDNQMLFKHPQVLPELDDHWDTTAWNMAWTLADAVQEATDGCTRQT
jgi:hypothetical protein